MLIMIDEEMVILFQICEVYGVGEESFLEKIM
jgi:hypothetical protein